MGDPMKRYVAERPRSDPVAAEEQQVNETLHIVLIGCYD